MTTATTSMHSYKNIEFSLQKLEKALTFQVLKMNEKFRATIKDSIFAATPGCLSVRSGLHTNPTLDPDTIWLFGRDHDLQSMVSTRYFKSNEERDTYFERVIRSLIDWDEFMDKLGDEPVNPVFIYNETELKRYTAIFTQKVGMTYPRGLGEESRLKSEIATSFLAFLQEKYNSLQPIVTLIEAHAIKKAEAFVEQRLQSRIAGLLRTLIPEVKINVDQLILVRTENNQLQ